jgi:hypothetical protein
MEDNRPETRLSSNLTLAQEQALFWLPSRDPSIVIDNEAIEQLITLGILCRDQAGNLAFTELGKSVYLELVMSREA